MAGFGVALVVSIWFSARLVGKQKVPVSWLVGLGALFLLSALTAIGSQVTIVSKVSSTDDVNENGTYARSS
jgi:hypothetical protein